MFWIYTHTCTHILLRKTKMIPVNSYLLFFFFSTEFTDWSVVWVPILKTSATENLLPMYIIKDIILQHSHFYSLASFLYIKALVLPLSLIALLLFKFSSSYSGNNTDGHSAATIIKPGPIKGDEFWIAPINDDMWVSNAFLWLEVLHQMNSTENYLHPYSGLLSEKSEKLSPGHSCNRKEMTDSTRKQLYHFQMWGLVNSTWKLNMLGKPIQGTTPTLDL